VREGSTHPAVASTRSDSTISNGDPKLGSRLEQCEAAAEEWYPVAMQAESSAPSVGGASVTLPLLIRWGESGEAERASQTTDGLDERPDTAASPGGKRVGKGGTTVSWAALCMRFPRPVVWRVTRNARVKCSEGFGECIDGNVGGRKLPTGHTFSRLPAGVGERGVSSAGVVAFGPRGSIGNPGQAQTPRLERITRGLVGRPAVCVDVRPCAQRPQQLLVFSR